MASVDGCLLRVRRHAHLMRALPCLFCCSSCATSLRSCFICLQVEVGKRPIVSQAVLPSPPLSAADRQPPNTPAGLTAICFLLRSSLILPTPSLHCVLLQGSASVGSVRVIGAPGCLAAPAPASLAFTIYWG